MGLHHFCDQRCWRCPLTARCRVHHRWSQTREPASLRKHPAKRVAAVVRLGLEVTIEELTELAELHGVPFEPGSEPLASDEPGIDRSEVLRQHDAASPLGLSADEYAALSWQTLRGLRGLLAGRRDREALDACERLEEMCVGVASKVVRALSSAAKPEHDPADLQSDANGSAKVALLLIEESRRAWRVLMRPGRTYGGGAPARFVALLDGLEAGLLRRFPRAFEFVRPGFDTGSADGAAGAIARALLQAEAGNGAPH
jgi:hypothetical protein